MIGSDLNVSLAPSLEGLTGSRIHSNANGAPSRWRGAVTEWMHSFRLRALCTFDHGLFLPHVEWDHDACWTHKNSYKGGLFQLDYMLFSEQVHGEACVVRGGYHLIIGQLMALYVWSARSCGVRQIKMGSRNVDGYRKLTRQNGPS